MAFIRGGDPFPEREPSEPSPPPPPAPPASGDIFGIGLPQPVGRLDDPAAAGGGLPPIPPTAGGDGANTLPPDMIGDIPPPPIPGMPQSPAIEGVGVGGVPGTEGSTFARPGPSGAPFRTPAFVSNRPPRFGPGVPMAGGDDQGAGGLDPDRVAELLRALAAGRGQ